MRHPGILCGLGGRVCLPVFKLPTPINPGGCSGRSELGLRQGEEALTSFPPAPGTVLQQFHQEAGQVVGAEHVAQGAQRKARGEGRER